MMRRSLSLLAACAFLALGAPAGAQVAPALGPAGQAFYVPPAPLPAGRHGDVIWSRPLVTGAALPHAAQNLLVRSESVV